MDFFYGKLPFSFNSSFSNSQRKQNICLRHLFHQECWNFVQVSAEWWCRHLRISDRLVLVRSRCEKIQRNQKLKLNTRHIVRCKIQYHNWSYFSYLQVHRKPTTTSVSGCNHLTNKIENQLLWQSIIASETVI